MITSLKKLGSVLFAIMLVVAVSGCGKAAEKASEVAMEKAMEKSAAEEGSDVDVDLDMDKGTVKIKGPEGEIKVQKEGDDTMTFHGPEGKVVVKGDEGSVEVTDEQGKVTMATGDAAKVPDDFPKDIPIYEGLKMQFVTTQEGSVGFAISGTTSDSIEKVTQYYAKVMPDNGWTENTRFSQADQAFVNYTKDNRAVIIAVAKSDEETTVSITTSGE